MNEDEREEEDEEEGLVNVSSSGALRSPRPRMGTFCVLLSVAVQFSPDSNVVVEELLLGAIRLVAAYTRDHEKICVHN